MAEGWERIEPLLLGVERPARYIDREWNAAHRDVVDVRVALAYPDTYEIGQANQAIAILYERFGGLEGVAAERVFVPWKDMAAALRHDGIALPTLESGTAVRECDVVGITLPYELTYTNVLELLDLAGIPLRASDRGEGDPLVIAGGPCAFNPEPVAAFFDAVFLGEAEYAAREIVELVRSVRADGLTRREALVALAGVPGVYVPSLYVAGEDGKLTAIEGAPKIVLKRIVGDLDSAPGIACPVVPYMDVVHDRATVEVLRGCTRGCRFCHAGMVYRPVRERSADTVVAAAVEALRCTGHDEVSLTSLSTTDHSRIAEIVRRLVRRFEGTGVSVSLPSLRADAFGVEMASLVSRGKKSGLTFAPEAGTQRLRDVINKNVTEEALIETVTSAFQAGWRRVKLYFMVGLPTETDEDVVAIGALVGRVLDTARAVVPAKERGGVKVAVSVSTFVPKAHTPFQWEAQLTRAEISRRQGLLRAAMPKKGVDLSWHDPETSFLEGVLARGGRQLADVIETAWREGAVLDAWSEEFSPAPWQRAFTAESLDAESVATAGFDVDAPLPWDHISAGLDAGFLREERAKALAGEVSEDCSVGACSACGVCDGLSVEVRTAGERRGG